MSRRRCAIIGLCVAVLVAAAACALWLIARRPEAVTDADAVDRLPVIDPDYVGVTIPRNICPMNFVVREEGTKYDVKISSTHGEPIAIQTRSGEIAIPPGPWRRLLDANAGEPLTITVSVKDAAGRWRRFEPVVNTIAVEKIDRYLFYREMPAYNLIWKNMGVYQRDLESVEVTPILENKGFGYGCANCHSFVANNPRHFALNVRGKTDAAKGGLVIARDGVVEKVVNTKTAFNPVPAIYLAWHPSGKALAFSTNRISQLHHTFGEVRTAVDDRSDMGLYLVEGDVVTTDPRIARADRLESTPAWSPDGEYLYFASARPVFTDEERLAEEAKRKREVAEGRRKKVWDERHEPYFQIERYKDYVYEIVRVRYDIDKNAWGDVETVVSTDPRVACMARPKVPKGAERIQRSASRPKISPDGRYLLFCVAAFGNFPIYQKTGDLYLLDLETKVCRPLTALNSEYSESWHDWSADGRWIVFSSKRPGGLLARPWFARFDADGTVSKPFILPQKDPAFYASYLRVYNLPTFATAPLPITQRQLLRALYDPARQIKATLDPKVTKTDADTHATPTEYGH